MPPDLPALLADSLRRDLAAFVDSVDEAGRDALASDPELRRAFGKVAASSRFVLETLTLEPALDPAGNPRAWDIEFGFADGKLWLFQVRPFIGNEDMQNVPALAARESGSATSGGTSRVASAGRLPRDICSKKKEGACAGGGDLDSGPSGG